MLCSHTTLSACDVGISEKKTISELRRIYFRLWERVFSGVEPTRRGKELEDFAIEIFSNSKRMSDVLDVNAPKLVKESLSLPMYGCVFILMSSLGC